jgi:hypothetical protein
VNDSENMTAAFGRNKQLDERNSKFLVIQGFEWVRTYFHVLGLSVYLSEWNELGQVPLHRLIGIRSHKNS